MPCDVCSIQLQQKRQVLSRVLITSSRPPIVPREELSLSRKKETLRNNFPGMDAIIIFGRGLPTRLELNIPTNNVHQ